MSNDEIIQLKGHLMMCSACTNYEKQSELIEKGIAKSKEKDFSQEDIDQLKKLINHKLADKNKLRYKSIINVIYLIFLSFTPIFVISYI